MSSLIKPVPDRFRNQGRVIRPFVSFVSVFKSDRYLRPEHNWELVGMSVQDLDEELAEQLGYEGEQGIVVKAVTPGSPADNAGIAPGDLIKAVNRHPIRSIHDYGRILDQMGRGDMILFLLRRGRNNFFVAIRIPR